MLLSGCVGKNAEAPVEVARIYIKEDGVYTPFLIVDEHDGMLLLLREHVKCDLAYAYEDAHSCYYAGSAIDDYLSCDYLNSLVPSVQEMITAVPVEITARESIGICGDDIETIQRKVFILSRMEATGKSSSTSLKEGEQITSLKANSLLAATNDAGEATEWWLRTPNTWYWNLLSTIGSDGSSATQMSRDNYRLYSCGVRPAFYIKKEAIATGQGDGWYVSKDQ